MNRWLKFCSTRSGGVDVQQALTRWWRVIEQRYNEEHRHYHTLRHVEDMFSHWEKYRNKLKDDRCVAMAIIFHDVIYDPKAKDNEEQSAALYNQFARDRLTDDRDQFHAEVERLILLTKSHSTEAHQTIDRYGSEDQHYFLDFDMAVLGWTPQDYDIYAHQIRQEYNHILDKDYQPARAKVLEQFLKTPNIFSTFEFRQTHEELARLNIQREIETLRNDTAI